MKFRSIVAISIAAFLSLLSVVSASAQGVVIPIVCDIRPCRPIPRPMPQPLPNALPVKSIELDTKINGQVATTHIVQIFRNDTQYTLEGTYFFPIPETASVVEFAIWENGKKLVGEVRSREEARRIYDEIVRRQRDPGLLEYAGKNLFQASIFPIPPNSDKKLELTYSEVLKAESGTVSYRYPLGTGRNVWANRMPLPMEDGIYRPQSGQAAQRFGTVSGKIEIVGKEALRNIYSPSHLIDVKRKGETAASVSFETKGNDTDFQLFFGLSNNDFGMSLVTYREPGKDGYFLLMLSPKDELADRELVNKDIVFVLDTSGSMADEGKMEKARKALLFGVRTLREGDRFNIVNFAGEEHLMERGLIAANAKGRRRAEEFIERLSPSGGTNINDSLIASLKLFEKGDRPKMLVFMTDGLPTVGESNVEKIIANLKGSKSEDVRIFPFGFGYDVNTTLLDRIGSENSGISDYVQPKEDLEVKVSNFFSRVSSPVLSDIELDFGPLLPEYTYPRKLTDIFRGGQMMIVGRYKNSNDLKNITLRLTGKAGKENKTFNYSGLDFPYRDDQNNFLPRLWASRRVGWLLEQIRANGETKETKDEVVELGTRYGLVTPYTSYLATDGSLSNIRQGMSMDAVRAMPAAKAIREKSGAGAVQLSVQQNSMQSNTIVVADEKKDATEQILLANTVNNQFVANKNFTSQNRVWVDSDYSETAGMPEVTVKFGSDEYFRLVSAESGLAPYLSLGEQVVVVWKGKVYRVTK
ncbi:MAG: VIT and VWA domain-containing protein [Pyrinomonadaceae bacterium]|nr:VIT and VWA domain-containing protein [Pyrinomonadaceae bacterium]